jgi:hypothetical protein
MKHRAKWKNELDFVQSRQLLVVSPSEGKVNNAESQNCYGTCVKMLQISTEIIIEICYVV